MKTSGWSTWSFSGSTSWTLRTGPSAMRYRGRSSSSSSKASWRRTQRGRRMRCRDSKTRLRSSAQKMSDSRWNLFKAVLSRITARRCLSSLNLYRNRSLRLRRRRHSSSRRLWNWIRRSRCSRRLFKTWRISTSVSTKTTLQSQTF